MIEKEYGKHVLVCDVCGLEHEFDSFDEAVEYKKSNGWKSRRGEQINLEDGWVDVCPDCIERGN